MTRLPSAESSGVRLGRTFLRKRAPALAALLVLLPLAGCIGSEDPGEAGTASTEGTTAPDPASASDGKETAPASPPGGQAQVSAEKPAEGNASAAPPREVLTPVSWAGSLSPAACVPAGVNSCFGTVLEDESNRLDLAAEGAPSKLSVTLTWTASSPLTSELGVGLGRVKPCGDGCVEGEFVGEPILGPSPLVLDVSGIPALAADESLVLLVWQKRLTPEPVYGFARTGQEFQVEGSLVSMA